MPTIDYHKLGRLLSSVCRLYRTRADRAMDKLGLYRGQGVLLMTLAQQDGMTQSEIAEKLHISLAAATKVIRRMEQAQHLQRRADAADARVSRVYLSDQGRALTAKICAAFGSLDRSMLAGLSLADLERLHDLLTRMQANLQHFEP